MRKEIIMSINENQEFEALNRKTKERNESVEEEQQAVAENYREVRARRKAQSIAKIIVVAFALGVLLAGFWGLEQFGWINSTFRTVLMCVAGAVAMFKVGYFWNEMKK